MQEAIGAVRTINYKLEGNFKVTEAMKTWFATDAPISLPIRNDREAFKN
jgi:hypothetical protein